jgi:hypothetical protein
VGFRSSGKPAASVSLDWRAPLSSEKNHAYMGVLHHLETSYCMFSVALDEAIGMRRDGRVQIAYQVLAVAPALCDKLTLPLIALLRAMTVHARHFGTAPNLASLDPQNFQQSRSQRVARFNGVFSHVLLTRRSQFLHKISTLMELTEELGTSFQRAIEDLGEVSPSRAERYWEMFDASHYDLNTCLRESVVLLKCFLHALPEKQLAEFQATLQRETQATRSTSPVPALTRNLAHRRLTPVKGQ